MTMGPEPRIRIFEMSVRLGIVRCDLLGFGLCEHFFDRTRTFALTRARLQARRTRGPQEWASAPEVSGLVRYRLLPTNTDIALHGRISPCESDFAECNRRAANRLSPQTA